MRWIFWRHRPALKNEGTDSSGGEREKISVLVEAEDSKSPGEEVRGVVISPLFIEAGRERFTSYRRKISNASFQVDGTANSVETGHGICALLHLPQTLVRGRHKFDSATERRIAYFRRGEYAGGFDAIRMMAPALRWVFSPPVVISGRSQSLAAIVTNPKLPAARKEG